LVKALITIGDRVIGLVALEQIFPGHKGDP